eukprot:CAMPEP_0175804368 /NCGR_PEP_ID=MMETSP0107_2-20121207/81_1 /TAXON_ID=195067 ORGANISM="Goniomonas pacifica, Strain CCMP1869" /NCGR_SAMPLE_ID=MMETSP0107_2 /ASSEMBLY_ACC=CAM_ASM_000203 /LENGTH=165 /DNA_ID=CAMNT_0017115709 /DNA_START=138 /DNA_END=635 /DNA_ORIENTATION=-
MGVCVDNGLGAARVLQVPHTYASVVRRRDKHFARVVEHEASNPVVVADQLEHTLLRLDVPNSDGVVPGPRGDEGGRWDIGTDAFGEEFAGWGVGEGDGLDNVLVTPQGGDLALLCGPDSNGLVCGARADQAIPVGHHSPHPVLVAGQGLQAEPCRDLPKPNREIS